MTRTIKFLAIGFSLLLSSCTTLKPSPHRVVTHAMPQASTGMLANNANELGLKKMVKQLRSCCPARRKEGMDWRLALIDHATTSIDIQYFIWSSDEAGVLVFDRLLRAADRGVRVRLLGDDIALEGNDDNIAVYSKHPNFEIRIYNPGRVRKSALGGLGEFMLHFRSLNHRMHNKLFIGSLNLDPRAVVINTENGIYFESPALGKDLAERFDVIMSPENSWRVLQDENGKLSWESSEGVVTRQPARNTGQRISDFFFQLLPIEGQL